MDLYIANCSKQDWELWYLRAEHKKPGMVKIPAGGQACLKGISPEEAKANIDHYATYGMRNVDDIHKHRGFAGLCYSEKPITIDGIATAIEHNMGELAAEGVKLRDAAAVAADDAIMSNGPSTSELKSTVVEIKENPVASKPNTEVNEVREIKPERPDDQDRRGRKQGPGR